MVKPELDASKDYYRVLGLSSTASHTDIRKAFLDLARTQHPDKNPGQEIVFKAKFQLITTAYDVLKDPELKKTYDLVRPIVRKPVVRKPVVRSTPQASPDTAKSSTRTTPGTAGRPSAVPRQAKTVPRPSSKQTPTARKDPFHDWNPPVPRPASARSQPSSGPPRGHYVPPSQHAASSPRKGASSTQSAFYSASPSSPLRKETKTADNARTSMDESRKEKLVPKSRKSVPDWTLREKWWAKSETAYSTFHTASSKYSPYSKDLPPRQDHESEAPSPASPPTTSNEQSASNFRAFQEQTGYRWDMSQSAYQRNADSRSKTHKVPRREPIFKDLRAGNPFFEGRTKDIPLDSDEINDFSEDSDEEALPKSRKAAEPLARSNASQTSSNANAEKLCSELDTSSDEETKAKRFAPSKTVPTDSKSSMPTSSHIYRTTTIESDDESDHDRSSEAKAQRSSSQAAEIHTPFSFKLNVSPQSAAATSRRVSGNVPPYVKFNAIPDLNFSSPNERATFNSSSPFSTPPTQTNTKTASTSSLKKHPRLDDRGDPRYDLSSQPDPSTPSSLADRLNSTSLNTGASPLRKPINTTSPNVKFSFNATNLSEMPRYPTETVSSDKTTSNSSASSHSTTPEIDRQSVDSDDSRLVVPVVPVVLLAPLKSLGTSQAALTQYLTQSSIFNAYNQEWMEYEKKLMELPGDRDIRTAEYQAALQRYQQVLQAHLQTCKYHGDMLAGPPAV